MEGFVKLSRKLLGWEWFTDAVTLQVWIYILLNAKWEDTRYRGIDVPKGSLTIGRKKIAEDTGLTEQQVRTALNHLKSTNEITIKSTNKYSLIIVNKWALFQCVEEKSTSKSTSNLTNNQPTTNQQLTTNKEYKEYKEYKNKEYYRHNEIPIYDSSNNRQMTDEEMSELLECVGKA